ncbi:MAG: hypothetical protein ABH829_00905 [archaeon]
MKTAIDFVLSFALFVAVLMYAFFYPIAFFERADISPQAEAAAGILLANAEVDRVSIQLALDYPAESCQPEIEYDVVYIGETINHNIMLSDKNVLIQDCEVDGNVKVNGGLLTILSSTIDGNVEVRGGSLQVNESSVDGNVKVWSDSSQTHYIRDNYVDGNVEFRGGTLYVTGNTIDGNLKADCDTTVAEAEGNDVSGNTNFCNEPGGGGGQGGSGECQLEVSGFTLPEELSEYSTLYTGAYSPADCTYKFIVEPLSENLRGVWISDSAEFIRAGRYRMGQNVSLCGVAYNLEEVGFDEIVLLGKTGTLDMGYLNNITSISEGDLARELSLEGRNFRVVSYFSGADTRTAGFPSGNVYSAGRLAVAGNETSSVIVEVW